MRYPISVLTRRIDLTNKLTMVSAVHAFLSTRTGHMLPSVPSGWRLFGNRLSIGTTESLVELAIERLRGRAMQQGGAKLQLWVGTPPEQALEHESFFSTPAASAASGRPQLMEQWALHLYEGDMSLIELSLLAANPDALASAAEELSWRSRHLAFCRQALYDDLFDCVWNCFAGAPELEDHDRSQKASEYWGVESFLLDAVKARILFTDTRRRKRRASTTSEESEKETFSGTELGVTKSARRLISLMDSSAAFARFEARRSSEPCS
jgi:hypothetical protein